MINKEPCGGVVKYDSKGNKVYQYACEVHLFDKEICSWQKETNAQKIDKDLESKC